VRRVVRVIWRAWADEGCRRHGRTVSAWRSVQGFSWTGLESIGAGVTGRYSTAGECQGGLVSSGTLALSGWKRTFASCPTRPLP
jgi:hypothetical protein